MNLIRVGGQLRLSEGLDDLTLHPVVLDASHLVTRLLIQKYDGDLHHPSPQKQLQHCCLDGRSCYFKDIADNMSRY